MSIPIIQEKSQFLEFQFEKGKLKIGDKCTIAACKFGELGNLIVILNYFYCQNH